jgi:nucleotide-binding universal stress UspA family protein
VTILIGLTPDDRGESALALGSLLARSAGDDVVVTSVVPTPWPPNPYAPDAEYLDLQEKSADHALDQARSLLGSDVAASYLVHRARSVSSGLIEVAARSAATQIVLGSSASGTVGRVALGGIAQRVMHSTELPVALAPAGWRADSSTRLARVTVGFGRGDRDSDLLLRAQRVAGSLGAELRVACFAVRPWTAYSGSIEYGAEHLVVDEWVKQLNADIAAALGVAEPTSLATQVETVLGQGDTWPDALTDVSWVDGEVLVIGASSSPVSRFFLGSHAAKIVRNAVVPVILVPRAALNRP